MPPATISRVVWWAGSCSKVRYEIAMESLRPCWGIEAWCFRILNQTSNGIGEGVNLQTKHFINQSILWACSLRWPWHWVDFFFHDWLGGQLKFEPSMNQYPRRRRSEGLRWRKKSRSDYARFPVDFGSQNLRWDDEMIRSACDDCAKEKQRYAKMRYPYLWWRTWF